MGRRSHQSATDSGRVTSRVRLASAAQAELDEAAQWYEERRRGLGDEFLDSVGEAVEVLREWAAIGTTVEVAGHGFRRIGINGFPYHLPYRMSDDEVQVLAVSHDRRRPGYWVQRSSDS